MEGQFMISESMTRLNRYQTIDYLDYQITKNQNELLQFQIEHLRLQNDILKKLMEQDVCINHNTIKFNTDNMQYQATLHASQLPKEPPEHMYT